MPHKISDRCKGCDDCAQICPVMAINGEMKEKHEIDPNRCIDCGACTLVCEYEGIFDENGKATKFVPAEQRKKPNIDLKLCDGCGLCVEECPSYCLELIPKEGMTGAFSQLSEPEKCVGCGYCVKHCPIGAIKMK